MPSYAWCVVWGGWRGQWWGQYTTATTHKPESMRGSDGSKGDGSNCNHFSSFGPRPAGSTLGHRRRAGRPGSGLSGTSGPTVAREEDAANGPREWNCCSRPGIRALRPRKGHILLASSAAPTVGTILARQRVHLAKAGKACPRGARPLLAGGKPGRGPGSALPVASLSLAPVPHGSASPAEPTRGRPAAAASPARLPATAQSAAAARPRLPCSPLRAANQCGDGQ